MAKPMTTKDKIREWISDNLRYMLLILAILAVVGLILLVVRVLSGNPDDGKSKDGGSAAVGSVTSTPEPTDLSDSLAGDVSDVSEPEENSPEEEALIFGAENQEQVSAAVLAYLTALSEKDLDGIRAVTDTLPDEDAAEIEAETNVESYHDLETYTMNGPSEGTYIAFASYQCSYKEIETALPMLTEFYLYTDEEGKLVIQNDTDSDTSVSDAMEAALTREEVQDLVEKVQEQYREALSKDSQLKAYVESIS